MSDKEKEKEVASQWLVYAGGDLKSAVVLFGGEDIPLRNVCYLAVF
jgi:hypothetical protein